MSEHTLTKVAAAGDVAIPEKHRTLAAQVQKLGDSLDSLAGQGHARSLLRMIRRPGWTTPQEAQLVAALVGHLSDQVDALGRAHDALLSAADAIGKP